MDEKQCALLGGQLPAVGEVIESRGAFLDRESFEGGKGGGRILQLSKGYLVRMCKEQGLVDDNYTEEIRSYV